MVQNKNFYYWEIHWKNGNILTFETCLEKKAWYVLFKRKH